MVIEKMMQKKALKMKDVDVLAYIIGLCLCRPTKPTTPRPQPTTQPIQTVCCRDDELSLGGWAAGGWGPPIPTSIGAIGAEDPGGQRINKRRYAVYPMAHRHSIIRLTTSLRLRGNEGRPICYMLCALRPGELKVQDIARRPRPPTRPRVGPTSSLHNQHPLAHARLIHHP
jgi:hypothetical protein